MPPRDTLYLFTDASVHGESYVIGSDGKQRRSLYGPSTVAWIGWVGRDFTARPALAGQAYIGRHGIQRAEYHGVIHGLQAALLYARMHDPLAAVVVHTDNQFVCEQLNQRKSVGAMREAYDAARYAMGLLEDRGMVAVVEWVPREDLHHRRANSMARGAWQQVFHEESWRPVPPTKPPKG